MTFAILQLSDIHFRDNFNSITAKASKVASAFLSVTGTASACLIAVTGDIAFSGTKKQYDLSKVFFNFLTSEICTRKPELKLYWAFVPGNHDCDFKSATDLRAMAIAGATARILDLEPHGAAVKELLAVQRDFFSFEGDFLGEDGTPWLEKVRKIELNDVTIVVRCLNSSFLSQLDEKQGQLYFPLQAIGNTFLNTASLFITLVHHPYPWYESNNGIALQSRLEHISDVVLTGHQHTDSAHTKISDGGAYCHYVAGSALQDEVLASGFNVLLCDLDQSVSRVFRFEWSEELFRPKSEPAALPFIRNQAARSDFRSNPSFLAELRDVGLGIRHPRKNPIELDDLFIYPSLNHLKLSGGEKELEHIESEDVLGFIESSRKVQISGSTQSGKTTFCRKLYTDLLAKTSIVPLLMNADDIRGVTPDAITSLAHRLFREQYDPQQWEAYRQLDKDNKLLIIDDWHKLKYKGKTKSTLVTSLTTVFDRIVLLADDVVFMGNLTKPPEGELRHFECCDIRQFGYTLRANLIEKWHALGAVDVDDHAFEERVRQDEIVINSMMKKNVLPSFPANVLLVLHARESMKSTNIVNGSYGYLFEALITTALAKVAADVTDVDTRYTFLARLAYYLHSKRQKTFSEQEVHAINEEYRRIYGVRVPIERLMQDLEDSGIVVGYDGNHSFRYRYIYHYFVARYYHDNSVSPVISRRATPCFNDFSAVASVSRSGSLTSR